MGADKATLELGTKPVGRLLLQYAAPAIIAMTASSLYNMVDSIFIGQGVGPLAISGLALTFPFMNLAGAFGAAVGVGASTCISVKLGQRDYRSAQFLLGNTITLNIIISIAFAVIALLFLDPILMFFGASEQTIPYAREYMRIILYGNVFAHSYLGLNSVLRAAGMPQQAMYATIFTVLLNTVLDALFIFAFNWGIKGAAAATVFSQMVALAWQLHLLTDKNRTLHLTKGIYKLKSMCCRNIAAIGMSPFLMNVCACIVVIFINRGLLAYDGDLAVGAYGIANRVAFIFVMIIMGINQGMQPIAGYNYGARQYDRLMRVLKLAMITATTIMCIGFVIGELFPSACAGLFTKDPQLHALAIRGLRIIMMAFPTIGFQIVTTCFFQSIGMARISIFLSLSRQMIFLLPLLLILPLFFGANGVWMALPFSDIIAALVSLFVLIRYRKKLFVQMK